jgi:hypothetical protein
LFEKAIALTRKKSLLLEKNLLGVEYRWYNRCFFFSSWLSMSHKFICPVALTTELESVSDTKEWLEKFVPPS